MTKSLEDKDIDAIAEAWVGMVVARSAETGGPEVPEEPVPSSWNGPYDSEGARMDPWGTVYCYSNPAERTDKEYDLFSFGPDGAQSDDDIFLSEDDCLGYTPA